MASNPYANKVEFAGQTVMDLTGDTVQPSSVLNGVTFHDRSGAPQTGSMITHDVYDGLDSTSTDDALSAKQGKVLNDKITYIMSVVSVHMTGKTVGTNFTIDLPSGYTYINTYLIAANYKVWGYCVNAFIPGDDLECAVSVNDSNKLSITPKGQYSNRGDLYIVLAKPA